MPVAWAASPERLTRPRDRRPRRRDAAKGSRVGANIASDLADASLVQAARGRVAFALPGTDGG